MIKICKVEGFQTQWLDNVPNEIYHANRDFVSSTQLKGLINESPEFFKSQFESPVVKASTAPMRLSTLVHHAVLEGEDFIKRYVVKPKFDMRKTLDKQAENEWSLENKHKIVVTQDDIQTLEGTYESIFRHNDAKAALLGAQFERSGYYIDRATGIPCRIRYDSYDKAGGILGDIKAVRSCKAHKFKYAIRDYRWDLSMAMYGDGIGEIDGKKPDNYVFIAVEKTAPYHCAVYEIEEETIAIGHADYRLALEKLRYCVKNNSWPSYQTEIQTIGLPESFKKERAA